jgi:hypothetical protein
VHEPLKRTGKTEFLYTPIVDTAVRSTQGPTASMIVIVIPRLAARRSLTFKRARYY